MFKYIAGLFFVFTISGNQVHASTLVNFDASHSKNVLGYRYVSFSVEFPTDKTKAPILRRIGMGLDMFTVGYTLDFNSIKSYRYDEHQQIMFVEDRDGSVVKIDLNSRTITIPGIINGTYGIIGKKMSKEDFIETNVDLYNPQTPKNKLKAWQSNALTADEDLPFVD